MNHLGKFIVISIILVTTISPVIGQDNYGMELIAQKPIGSWAWIVDIESIGDYAFLACGGIGLQVIDTQDLNSSNSIGILREPGIPISKLDVNNGYLIAQSDESAVIIDVSDPSDPLIISTFGDFQEFEAEGDIVYAFDWGRFYIYSISDIENPELLFQSEIPGIIFSICAKDELLFMSNSLDNIYVLDVSNPQDPTELGTIDFERGTQMKIYNDMLCIINAERDTWNMYDISNQDSMYQLTEFEIPHYINDYHVIDDYLIMLHGFELVVIYNISDINNPEIVDQIQLEPDGAHAIQYTNERILVGGREGLHIIDATDMENPSFSRYESGTYQMNDMDIRDNMLYVGYKNGGLRVYDIEDVDHIVEVAHIPIQKRIQNLVFDDDDNLFVMGNSMDSILVFNVSNIQNWQQIGGLNLRVFDMDIQGDIAIASVWNEDLVSIDISDPTNLRIINDVGDGYEYTYDIQILGDYAYTASSALWVNDISDVRDIRPVASIDNPRIVRICGKFDYMTGLILEFRWRGIYVFDCTDPTNPVRMGGVLSEGYPLAIINAPVGRSIYTAEKDYGVRSFYITDDFRLWETGYYNTPGRARSIAADGNRLYVGDFTHIQVLETSEALNFSDSKSTPDIFELSNPYPNPFNSTTSIKISLHRSQSVKLNLIDITGRTVLTTNYGNLKIGNHDLSISASTLNSGLYFAQVMVGNEKHIRSIVVMK